MPAHGASKPSGRGEARFAQALRANNTRTQTRVPGFCEYGCRIDSVMKFGYACTFTGKPRGEPPAPPPEKTTPGLTAPAGLPRAVPPNKRVHLPRRACSLPHRTPPASCVWRAYPPPAHQTCHEAMYWAALAVRCAPACLRAPDWPASPQRARFRLLGAFRIWFGYLERRVAARNAIWVALSAGSFGMASHHRSRQALSYGTGPPGLLPVHLTAAFSSSPLASASQAATGAFSAASNCSSAQSASCRVITNGGETRMVSP